MRLACVNAVLAVHCNYMYLVGIYMYMYAVIQNWLLALYDHFIHVCCLETSKY